MVAMMPTEPVELLEKPRSDTTNAAGGCCVCGQVWSTIYYIAGVSYCPFHVPKPEPK
jgi:hypothetical protein